MPAGDQARIGDRAGIADLTEDWVAKEDLSWAEELVEPALRLAVDALPGSMRHIAGYHLAWWDDHGRPAGPEAPQAIRSTLVLLSARAVGGHPDDAVPAAVAVELAHHFSLLHDDVIDGRISRRGRPTAWSVFGLRAAILAGDALLATALEVLAASGHPSAEDAMRGLSAGVLDVVDAQSADIALGPRRGPDGPERTSATARKVGGLLGCACSLGAAFGGGDLRQVEHLRRFGEDLGCVLQQAGTDPAHLAGLDSVAGVGRIGWDDDDDTASTTTSLTTRDGGTPEADDLVAQALAHLESAGLTAQASAELGSLARMASSRYR